MTGFIKFLNEGFGVDPGIQFIFYLFHFTGRKYQQQSKNQGEQTSDFADPNYGINNNFRNKRIFLRAKKYSGKLCNIQREKEKEERKSGSADQQTADHNMVVVNMMRYFNIFIQEIYLFIKIYLAVENFTQGFRQVG